MSVPISHAENPAVTSSDKDIRPIALTALRFLSVSSRPVDVDELSEMVAIKSGVGIFIEFDRLFDPMDLLTVCSSLITISRDSWVQLSHYSVHDFLTSEQISNGPASHYAIKVAEAHLAIAQLCMTYLLSFDQSVIGQSSSSSSSLLSSLDETLDMECHLLQYAATEWSFHVRQLPPEHQIQTKEMVLRLLDRENMAFHGGYRSIDKEKMKPVMGVHYIMPLS